MAHVATEAIVAGEGPNPRVVHGLDSSLNVGKLRPAIGFDEDLRDHEHEADAVMAVSRRR